MKRMILAAAAMAVCLGLPQAEAGDVRWTPEQAKTWYDAQPWLLGSNYLPADAINQLEMWQPETFNPERIDLELVWAENLGMNTMRVFLHDQLWAKDPKGFARRIDQFLAIAARHRIKPLLVLFDSCWDPEPKLGPQRPPIPGVHNSGWVESPGTKALDDPAQEARLEVYVKGVIGKFANDDRILGWDVWNEPDNEGGGNYQARQSKHKTERVAYLLPKVFAWARSVSPKQPLTSGVWNGKAWDKAENLNAVQKAQLEQSDVVTFHNYDWPEGFAARVEQLKGYGRPIFCTEYMARGAGSTFDGVLPVAKRMNIGMMNWGLVKGKSQTHFPWDSWQKPYVLQQPTVWFHDIFQADGTPYRQREVDLLKALSAAPKGVVPASVEPGGMTP